MNRPRGRQPRRQARSNADAPAAIGQRIEVTLERLTHDGRGIGRWQGRTVFVEGALPGEQVQARVVRARSKLIEARQEQILQASAERQPPRCRHAELCGGCSLQHMPHAQQLEIKQQALAQQLQHFAGVQPAQWTSALQGPAYGYRQRTRVSVRWDGRRQALEVGFRQRASNDLVAVQECPVLVPVLQPVIAELPALLRSLASARDLGHVELIGTEQPALVVRHLGTLDAADQQQLAGFAAHHGLALWLQPGDESSLHCVSGDNSEPSYSLVDQQLRLSFSPGDFTQVNAEINQAMVNQALDWLALQPGEQVLDLFCGIGNFALAMARLGAQVTGIEGSEAMVLRAQHNARINGLEALHFFSADLSKPLELPADSPSYTAALLDPPRDGAEQLVADLAALGIERILYISCNPATLARDAGILATKGYGLVRAGVMDMFPQTSHVEAMALFRKH
ncbi:MAG: 23S rRNA (uracil(1939)-C(5))-methyltransferase RlmD [Halopseudomonas sp.]|uniref:23S rRNA (uracil(1939)-C(5))-methyltransferase RlmD n=1 Tax=Halopseudomonas sp. TaxID=2901191 RepID=UPI0030030680